MDILYVCGSDKTLAENLAVDVSKVIVVTHSLCSTVRAILTLRLLVMS
jgi:carbonic anhydrase